MRETPSLNYRRPIILGLLSMVILVGGLVAWTSKAQISGAIIASGSVVVQGKPKSVQHLDGGIVQAINVEQGHRVEAGDVLVELDATTISANLAIYEGRWRDAQIRKERLLAELRDEDGFAVPPSLLDQFGAKTVQSSVDQQLALLEARKLTRSAQIDQLSEQIKQFQNQITGTEDLIGEKTTQIRTFDEEYAAVTSLVERELATRNRLMSLERSQADLRGQLAEHRAEIARIRNAISETKISQLQVEREFREKVVAELEQVNVKIEEMEEQMRATQDQLARTAIKSPVTGIIHELSIFTIGGVVQPGQVIMQVIPDSGDNEIELSIDTRSVDQVSIGQPTILRFPAFLARTTPELQGYVTAVSPSSVVDEATGVAFYRISVEIADGEEAKLEGKTLVPGMPVEGLIPTEERTVVAYLIKPLADQLVKAFREE